MTAQSIVVKGALEVSPRPRATSVSHTACVFSRASRKSGNGVKRVVRVRNARVFSLVRPIPGVPLTPSLISVCARFVIPDSCVRMQHRNYREECRIRCP